MGVGGCMEMRLKQRILRKGELPRWQHEEQGKGVMAAELLGFRTK